MSDPAIAVIIPYFQREAGILRRALASVFAQTNAPSWEIIAVDDGSPVPAADEMRELTAEQRERIRVIKQPNGGPGKARNTGLDAVRSGTKYVAFLDSDDTWFEQHLADAHFALEGGFDFYFSDLYHLDRDESAFKRSGRPDLAQHPLILGRDHLHEYRGDMIGQIITANLIGTSTVVFRREGFAAVRFRTEYRNAGEDYLFWLEVSARKARFIFSSTCDARYGRGVNVYSGAGWGTEELLRRIHDEMRYRKVTGDVVPVTPAQARVLDDKVDELRVAFVSNLMHRLLRLQRIPLRLMLNHALLDPKTFIGMAPIALRLAVQRKH